MVYEKKTQNLIEEEFLLIIVQIDIFSFLIQSWSTLFFMLKDACLKYHRFHLLAELYHCKENLCYFFSFSQVSITFPSIGFTTLESLFSQLVFRKEFSVFLFLSAISEKQGSTISESLKLIENKVLIFDFSKKFQKRYIFMIIKDWKFL